MPSPPTPPDCDLRGLGYMPLDVQRLRDSDLALASTGEEFKAAVLLWCISWTQVPAASLPDDDRLLAALLRLDARAWKRVRPVALSGWVKCDDGRLYHGVVAEKAREAWQERIAYRAKRDKDRARLEAWRAGQKQPLEPDGNGSGNASETHVETRFETQPEEKGTGSGGKEEGNAEAFLVAAASPLTTGKRSYPEDFDVAWKAYPHHAGRSSKPGSLAEWRKLPADERAELPAAIQRFQPHVEVSCGGKGAPDMAVWLKQGKHLNWIETDQPSEPFAWSGPADIWEAVAARKGADWARGYLGKCEARGRTLFTTSQTIDAGLRREVGRELTDLGASVVVGSPPALATENRRVA